MTFVLRALINHEMSFNSTLYRTLRVYICFVTIWLMTALMLYNLVLEFYWKWEVVVAFFKSGNSSQKDDERSMRG